MGTDNRRVGENIKKMRTRLGLTQQNIADQVGITKQTVCKIEKTGSTSPHTLSRIAEALHADVHELYEPADEPGTESGYKLFIIEAKQKAVCTEYMYPLVKAVNDTVADSIYQKIMDEFARKKALKSVLENMEPETVTYTCEDMEKICQRLYFETFSGIAGIFLNSEDE